LSLDRLCIKWSYFWDNVMTSEATKMWKVDFSKYHEHIAKGGFRYFKTRKTSEIKDLYDNKLCGVSSVPAAMDLALKIGYNRILLFGVDQRFIQGKSHFWEFYPRQKRPKFIGGINIGMKEQKKRCEENKSYFEELKRIADNMDVEILNCSKRISSLDIFPKIHTKEGLRL